MRRGGAGTMSSMWHALSKARTRSRRPLNDSPATSCLAQLSIMAVVSVLGPCETRSRESGIQRRAGTFRAVQAVQGGGACLAFVFRPLLAAGCSVLALLV